MELLSINLQSWPCALKLCIYVRRCKKSRLLTLLSSCERIQIPAQNLPRVFPAFLLIKKINCNPFPSHSNIPDHVSCLMVCVFLNASCLKLSTSFYEWLREMHLYYSAESWHGFLPAHNSTILVKIFPRQRMHLHVAVLVRAIQVGFFGISVDAKKWSQHIMSVLPPGAARVV